jgi:hypothetical protein
VNAGRIGWPPAVNTKQLKAAAILNEEAKKNPNHPGIAHYLIHSYDFAPLAAMCVETARHYDKIAPEAPHALHMPSHIYSILGMWEDSVQSNVAARKAAEDYWAKNSPGKTAPPLPHLFDFMVTADLQMEKDGEAKQLVDASTGLSNFPFPSLGIDTGLAAIPARYALDRGQWLEAAYLPVRDSQFPAAQSITYFARALGTARAGDLAAARTEIGHLDEIGTMRSISLGWPGHHPKKGDSGECAARDERCSGAERRPQPASQNACHEQSDAGY